MASVFLYHVVGVDGGEARDGLSYTRRRRWNPLFVLSESRWSAASRRTGSVGEVSGGEVALDVDETIFVAMAEDVDEMTKLTLTRWSADWRGATELYEQAGQSGKYERAKVALEKASKGQEMQASYPSIPLLR
ncbi:hypothetical protein Bca4012_062608 [Brassica carinata]